MSNDFLPFAVGGSANVTPQATYAADTAILQNGFSAGVAKSPDLNKVWRQSSIMAAVLAQFIVDQSGQNAVDDGTTVTLEANLLAAIKNATKQTVILTDTGTANAYAAANAPALTILPSTGYVQRVNIAHANTGASTYAPDGLTAKPVYGLGLQPLQGGELPVGVAVLMYLVQAGVNSGSGAWIIIESLGGSQQVAPATKSNQAVNLGQFQTITAYLANQSGSVGNPITATTYSVSTQAITFPAFSKAGAFRVVAQLIASGFSQTASVEGQFQNTLYDGSVVVGGGNAWSVYKKNSGYGWSVSDTFISGPTYAPGATVTFTQRVVVGLLEDNQFSLQNCFMRLWVIEA